MFKHTLWLLGFLLVLTAGTASAQQSVEEAVTTTGTRVANWSFEHTTDRMSGPNIGTVYGILKLADASGNESLREKIEQKFRPELLEGKNPHRGHDGGRPSHQLFALVPLKLHDITGREAYRKRGLELAEKQYQNANSFGMPGYTKRGHVGDIYAATAVQSLAYAASGERKYLERAIRQVLYYSALYQQSNGLFHHGHNTPLFWGRGVGWAAAAMTELLSVMPDDDPKRPQVLAAYRLLVDGLLKYRTEEGLWRQLINRDSWVETSSTGMFLYALSEGVQHQWLRGTAYSRSTRAVERGWKRLEDRFIDQDGRVHQVCVHTGVAGSDNVDYYLQRSRKTGDPHGQAAVLWAASSIIELLGR